MAAPRSHHFAVHQLHRTRAKAVPNIISIEPVSVIDIAFGPSPSTGITSSIMKYEPVDKIPENLTSKEHHEWAEKQLKEGKFPHKTVPFDPRFPNQNQTRKCWQNYVDYYRCTNLRGEDYKPCKIFLKNYITVCPGEWVEKWNEQRENGSFPAKL